METSELLKKVRKIEIKTKGLSHHIFSGEYQSAFKGRGMSFSEVRNYQYGDDVRNIDWNVTARSGEPFVKVFEEERELTVILLIDISQSSFFGTVEQLKSEIITEISAVFAFSATTNNDKVGVILFSDRVEKYIPPKKGRQHILRIIRELIDFEPVGTGTDLGVALQYFTNLVKKRSICIILSDFLSKGYENPLRIAARRHDLIGVHLIDPRDAQLPNVGLIRAVDAESGQVRWIDTGMKSVRENHAQWFNEHQQYFTNVFRKSGSDVINIEIPSAESEQKYDGFYTRALLNFFKKRSR